MVLIQHLVIIGVGSIGASLGMALRRAGVVGKITGVGRSQANLEYAVSIGAIDAYTTDVAQAASTADVVFLAVPMGSMSHVMQSIQPHLPTSAIVTDGGSAKSSIIQAFKSIFGSTEQLVAGHPIAGTERSGAQAAMIDLYQNRRVILTPDDSTHSKALELITQMWQSAGACVEIMAADHHDKVLAFTSHLPHMLAFGLVDSLSGNQDVDEIFRYVAGGFKDFTRIASSDPTMWRDICLSNREALLGAMDTYLRDMKSIYEAVDTADADALMAIFSNAKTTRDKFMG